jgi:hypothetical protein
LADGLDMFRLGVTATGGKSVRQAASVVRNGFRLVGSLGVEPRWMRSLCQKDSTCWGNGSRKSRRYTPPPPPPSACMVSSGTAFTVCFLCTDTGIVKSFPNLTPLGGRTGGRVLLNIWHCWNRHGSRAYLVSFTLCAQWRLVHCGARAEKQPRVDTHTHIQNVRKSGGTNGKYPTYTLLLAQYVFYVSTLNPHLSRYTMFLWIIFSISGSTAAQASVILSRRFLPLVPDFSNTLYSIKKIQGRDVAHTARRSWAG